MAPESKSLTYTISRVSEMTGIPASTIRYWERTHGLIEPDRTEGGHRLYSQDDVERLRWLKGKIERDGVRPEVAHEMLREELARVASVAGEAGRRGAVMILVAERDPITAELEEYFLREEGYDVHVVLDGRKAVEEAEKQQPDLIVLDVILPGLNGLKVCEKLKSNPKTSAIPVLVFTMLDVRERAMKAGADAFLLKPIEHAELVDAVKSLLTHDQPASKAVTRR